MKRGITTTITTARTPAVKEHTPMTTAPNLQDPDGFYEAWLAAQESMNDDESADYNARLVLLLANQIGSHQVLRACIDAARAA